LAPSSGNEALDHDIARLLEAGHEVELFSEGARIGVVIRGYVLPAGVYNKDRTDVLLETSAQYPLAAMDMFWVHDDLRLANGGVPAGASPEMQFGRAWLRYSWHRNTPWVPGRDDIVSHLEFVADRLRRGE